MNTIVSHNGRTQQGVLSTLLPQEAGIVIGGYGAATDSTRLLYMSVGISLERIVFSRIVGRSLSWSQALPVKVCGAKPVIGWTRPQFGLMCGGSIARGSKRNSGADHCVGRGWL
jgi:hypothetical protein